MLYDQDGESQQALTPIIGRQDLVDLQVAARAVDVHRDVADYIIRLVQATREHESTLAGCSPRGAQMLFRAAQSRAFVGGRDVVLPDDVQAVAEITLAHRLVMRQSDRMRVIEKRALMADILNAVGVPA